MDLLKHLGWNDALTADWESVERPDLQPGRVVADFGTSLRVALPEIHTAELTGTLAHYADREQVPKVGDWVAVRVTDNGHTVVEQLLLRRSEFVRKVAGKRTVKQVIAANVDVAFVLLALDDDFSVERLKRYLYQLNADKIEPVVVLNKADKTDDLESFISQLSDLQAPIIVTSAIHGEGIEAIRERITDGQTAVMIGSSGVGKSTLTNQLLGADLQATQSVRASDSTGRHTTVHRELFVLPSGGMLIDTPGIRELQLWGTEADLQESYDDIVTLATGCKYTTCQHQSEVGCAIQAALQQGNLSTKHFANYQKMKAELRQLEARSKVRAQQGNKKSSKNLRRQSNEQRQEIDDEMNYN